MLDLKRVLAAKPKIHEEVELATLSTVWGEELDPESVLPEHPEPQFARATFQVLNGWWDCAFTGIAASGADGAPALDDLLRIVGAASAPAPDAFDRRILVPFSPEAPLSGISRQLKPGELLWYRRTFDIAALPDEDECLLLHFQAVDHTCSCRVNGKAVGCHVGGYSPFAFDITDCLVEGQNEIVLCVADASELAGQVRGKQRIDRGDIWYTAQSGIWQTVWLERVPALRIAHISVVTEAAAGVVKVKANLEGTADHAVLPPLEVQLRDADGQLAAHAHVLPDRGDTDCMLTLAVEQPRLWSPADPHLYRMELTFGEDTVRSFCGLRDVCVKADASGTPRLHLNGKPLFLKGVLDQGYWPDGLMTAPSDDALVHDLEAARTAGFNLMRKHIKVENARWYWHCDRMGLLVWQDIPNGGEGETSAWHRSYKPTLFKASWNHYSDAKTSHIAALGAAENAFEREWTRTCREVITHLDNHPCVVSWVLFNEGWGQFRSAEACAMVASLDPTRPIDAVSGWYDQGDGDYKSVHNYFRPLEVWPDKHGRAFVISECGGLTLHVAGHSSLPDAYGYAAFDDADSWTKAVCDLLAHLDSLEGKGLAGYVYTQLSDIEEEVNGLLSYDRRVNKLELGEPESCAS